MIVRRTVSVDHYSVVINVNVSVITIILLIVVKVTANGTLTRQIVFKSLVYIVIIALITFHRCAININILKYYFSIDLVRQERSEKSETKICYSTIYLRQLTRTILIHQQSSVIFVLNAYMCFGDIVTLSFISRFFSWLWMNLQRLKVRHHWSVVQLLLQCRREYFCSD